MKWLKNGAGKKYISRNYSCTISALVKILLIKFEVHLYSQCFNLNHEKKQNSNQNVKVERMAVLVKTLDHYHYKFQLFQLSCKIVKEFETI